MGSTRICVQLCVYVTFVAAIVITTNRDIFECPGPLMYYKDLRCTPIYDDKDNCPKKFNCNHIKLRSRKKCYINGRVYKPNQFLYDKDSNVCDTSCICTLSPNRNQIAAFDCINFQCPKKKIKDGCYLRQDPTICCQNPIEICPKTQQDRPFCIVNNHRYLDGEYFKVNEEPDLICICQPGYKHENVPPYCMKPNHSPCHPAFSHEDYFNRNCAPVYNYYEMDKCHVKMLCQVSGDTTIPRQLPFIMDDDWSNMCIFGNLLMRIGDRLEPSSIYTIDCICEIPPVLTCIHIS
ncbi:PREDICTED: uncharacterized protein LOC108754562 [Trachymyrmex septentrionalis]|uniref:uncharacterized protein LOC108754562 n=1 Tax=Trachymyrmex septentrionalis TaxID=34720 RepID=UPI00084F4EB1|nr:PREDICTED: uncharacterized protein LOC108754562 [Trachymyrmex septentrionalis]